MKILALFIFMVSQSSFAEAPCDLRLGSTLGIRAVEFTTGNAVHSKLPLNEMSVASLREEMVSLQDMGICETKIQRKRCILKFEKNAKGNQITMFRGADRWLTWNLAGKNSAQKFIRILQQTGHCQ